MQKAVVITGVSSGIGLATAEQLINRGYRVFGSVRKQADGDRISERLGNNFVPLLFDVTDDTALAEAAKQVQAAVGDRGLHGLINNAGIAPNGPLMHATKEEVRRTFEINVFGALSVTQAFLPLLGARKACPHPPGRIVNLSSISGGVTFPLVAVYAMSKHAVEALSDGLRRELSIYGIEVSAIEPGSIKTAIWDKVMPDRDTEIRLAQTDYAEPMANFRNVIGKELKQAKPMHVVTDAIIHALEAQKPKPRYPLVGLWYFGKIVPTRMLDRLMVKLTGLKKLRPPEMRS